MHNADEDGALGQDASWETFRYLLPPQSLVDEFQSNATRAEAAAGWPLVFGICHPGYWHNPVVMNMPYLKIAWLLWIFTKGIQNRGIWQIPSMLVSHFFI